MTSEQTGGHGASLRYNPPVPTRGSSILIVLLAAVGLVWTPHLAGLVTLLPGADHHHAHVHAHGGAVHVHVHSHAPEHDGSADSNAHEHRATGDHPENHDGPLVQIRRGPAVSPAGLSLLASRLESTIAPMEHPAARLLRPPARAGPGAQLGHLRTVMLQV